MPDDVLEKIMSLCGFPGLRAMEGVCRAFRAVAVARGLWQVSRPLLSRNRHRMGEFDAPPDYSRTITRHGR
eukprot:5541972-Pyramimonas_sp.AAC.1